MNDASDRDGSFGRSPFSPPAWIQSHTKKEFHEQRFWPLQRFHCGEFLMLIHPTCQARESPHLRHRERWRCTGPPGACQAGIQAAHRRTPCRRVQTLQAAQRRQCRVKAVSSQGRRGKTLCQAETRSTACGCNRHLETLRAAEKAAQLSRVRCDVKRGYLLVTYSVR